MQRVLQMMAIATILSRWQPAEEHLVLRAWPLQEELAEGVMWGQCGESKAFSGVTVLCRD